jgi:hypothetical protein
MKMGSLYFITFSQQYKHYKQGKQSVLLCAHERFNGQYNYVNKADEVRSWDHSSDFDPLIE